MKQLKPTLLVLECISAVVAIVLETIVAIVVVIVAVVVINLFLKNVQFVWKNI